jgi:hypothetical protein
MQPSSGGFPTLVQQDATIQDTKYRSRGFAGYVTVLYYSILL